MTKSGRRGIGSSDAPAICGVSPYETPWQCWARHVGLLPAKEMTEEMRWGNKLEHVILHATSEEIGLPVEAAETRWGVDRPWQRATPDAVACGAPWLIEAKALRVEPPEEPRLDWLVQVQHQMMVFPEAEGAIIAAMGALAFRTYRVAPHPALQRALLAAEERFLALVESETPPPVRAEDNRWLAQAYPLADTLRVAHLGAEALEWDRARQAAKEHGKRWQKVEDLAEARIKMEMGPARTAVLPDGTTYSWSPQKRKEYTVPEGMVRVLRRRGER